MSDDLSHFKVSAGLKNIIGGELITDDFVAIFELVKNAYDAHASKVIVRFERVGKPEEASLTITDDGKGMTREDLRDKWLWVAYSAKRDGTEDKGVRQRDYRDRIGEDRPFAGAKGIGRFSCDRLGRHLEIYTRRDAKNPNFETLLVDWKDFESIKKERFENIEIEHGVSPASDVPGVGQGTRICIRGLRSAWTEKRLFRLREELQKLTLPSEDKAESDSLSPFRIFIEAPDFADADRRNEDEAKRINGEVRNFLFERLRLKTTYIVCKVSETGKTIETELRDRGTLIYKITEPNTENTYLKNINFRIFYLNKAAKLAFKSTVGVEPVKYGSVMLYKNGVRVQPYGREGDDGFGIDRRKQQGTSRYLGTRDLAGRIEIISSKSTNSGDEPFRESTSRNHGLIESPEREELLNYFKETVLRRLEGYVVDVIKWGNPPKNEPEEMATQPGEVRNEIFDMVRRLSDARDVLRFDTDPNLLQVISERQADSLKAIVNNIEKVAQESEETKLASEARQLRQRVQSVIEAEADAAKEARSEKQLRILTQKQLDAERQQNKIVRNLVSPDDQQRAVLEHWVAILAAKISNISLKLIQNIQADKAHRDEDLALRTTEGLWSIKFHAEKLLTLKDLVSNSGFTLQKQRVPGNLARCFFECVDRLSATSGPKMEIAWDSGKEFQCKFNPVEIAMLVDNLADNAEKAGARKMIWQIRVTDSSLHISVVNDGNPLAKHMVESLFQMGATSTRGKGLGLFTCKRIALELNGDITFEGNDLKNGGAKFELVFRK